MTTITLEEAIKLLERCKGVSVNGETISMPNLGELEDDVFLQLEWIDNDMTPCGREYRRSDNPSVQIHGGMMQLHGHPDYDIEYGSDNLRLFELMQLEPEFPHVIKRWLKDGDPGMSDYVGNSRGILVVAGRRLDKSGSGEIVGDMLWEAENGKFYTGSVEFTMYEANPETVKEALEDLESGEYELGGGDEDEDREGDDEP